MIWALTAAVLLAGLLAWLRSRWLVVTVSGPSMRPTLQPGDRVLVRRRPARRVRVGQIVVVAAEPDLAVPQRVVKRVVAVPGDPVPPGITSVRDELVPPARLLLLGDNARESLDSRRLGYYDAGLMLGVVVRAMSTHPARPGSSGIAS
ncbi:signal peptidase I [Micromonospora olivasterospora]|uniref:Signal peptidase I n=1 Tax=Micromonospora olivasterospora TaxID=1880 RepID=A0A562IH93_MICOL|nr:signal peptidase I [Micromonospora olivasterospora]TWH70387.1 signal peptidase I/APA family basic amino acid/polyamine antiporter [Micromonospora olivasterospora]